MYDLGDTQKKKKKKSTIFCRHLASVFSLWTHSTKVPKLLSGIKVWDFSLFNKNPTFANISLERIPLKKFVTFYFYTSVCLVLFLHKCILNICKWENQVTCKTIFKTNIYQYNFHISILKKVVVKMTDSMWNHPCP